MMRKLLYLVLLLVGCSDTSEVFPELQFKKVGSISLPLSPTQKWGSRGIGQFYHNGDPFIYSFDEPKKELSIYDVQKKSRVRIIPISPFNDQRDNLWSLYVHNLDSIFIQLNAAKHPSYWHDSTLMLLNSLGEIEKVFDLSSAPIWTSDQPDIPEDSAYYIAGFSLGYHDGKICLPMSRWSVGIGDTLFSNPGSHPIGFLDISGQRDTFYFPSFETPTTIGEYFPFQCQMPKFSRDAKNHLVLSFMHTPNFWVLDDSANTKFRLASVAFDSMPPLSLGTWVPRWDRKVAPGSGSYSYPKYDPYRNCYWRVVTYPIDSIESAELGVKSRMGVLLSDENFHVLGEGLLPEAYGWGFYTPKGIAMGKINNSDAEVRDSITFDIFEIELADKRSTDDYMQEAIVTAPKRKPGGLAAYINQVHGLNQGDFVVLFVPADNGCPGCLDYMLDFFRRQNNSISRRPIFCVVGGKDEQTVLRKLGENLLTPQDPNLMIDPTGLFMSYVGKDFTQGRVLLFSDGKMSGEIIVNPAELEAIPIVIDDFFSDQTEK